ncbi:MAG TPA: helix-turn-helix transcriptional regulator [Candidatus Limnocylindrales bacterium]|nr:helix-turn-helix transcriptional regulator [Candidatus Limnocylindrales bacterium]
MAARRRAMAPALLGRDGDDFNEWLQSALKARRMSQRQLAQRSGVDHSSISRLISGNRVPSLRTAMRIAQGVDPGDSDIDGLAHEAARTGRAPARVEYALRSDDRLTEADVRAVMLYYVAVRSGQRHSHDTASDERANGAVMSPRVARATATPGLWGPVGKPGRPRRS